MKIYEGAILYAKSSSEQRNLRPKIIIKSMPKYPGDYIQCESDRQANYGLYTEDFLINNYTSSIKHILKRL